MFKKTDVHYLNQTFTFPGLKTVSLPIWSNLGNIIFFEENMKNLNFMEGYIMGIWIEIIALALLLSISINLQSMYLLMKKKNENSGSWELLMTKTFTLIFLFTWALMILGYFSVSWKNHQLCFSLIYYMDKKWRPQSILIWVLHLWGKYEKKIDAISVPLVFRHLKNLVLTYHSCDLCRK